MPSIRVLAVLCLCGLAAACDDEPTDAPATAAAASNGAPQQERASKHGQAADPADWCAGHGLPESKCTKCNPELTPKFKQAGDWCAEHQFPESACPICNPQAPPGAKAKPPSGSAGLDPGDWCTGHGLPESKCTKCNPELRAKFEKSGDWCAEHELPESACPVCNPVPGAAPIGVPLGSVVRLASAEVGKRAGIHAEPARLVESAPAVECTARIDYDQNHVADIRAAVPGIVRRVHVDLGETVERGKRMFELASARVGELQGALHGARESVRTAKTNLARQRELHREGVTSARQVEVAQRELAAAEAAKQSALSALAVAGRASGGAGRYELSSPLDGVVVARPAVVGTQADSSTRLATVADTSKMWALCDVADVDAAALKLGQAVEVRVDGIAQKRFEGEISFIAAEVDPRTRTVSTRIEVANPDGLLRKNQFGTARVRIGEPARRLSVPSDALQRIGPQSLVFVQSGGSRFEPRLVRVVRRANGHVEVTGDLQADERVVDRGAFLLKTELLPGSIGAGCCEVEAPGSD